MNKKNKKGYFFSLDALFALAIILGVVLLIKPQTIETSHEINLQKDLLFVLSSVKVGEIDNSYVQSLIAEGSITNLNQSVLEQIGEFYATSDPKANLLTQEIFNSLELNENIGLYFNNMEIATSGSLGIINASEVSVARHIISGIREGEGVTGYSSRAFLSSENKVNYFYFGGYIGDGNITVDLGDNVDSVKVEAVFSGDFNISVNNGIPISHSPIADVPYSFNIMSGFAQGNNYLRFTSDENLYVAGGFIKINYNDSSPLQTTSKHKLPGIQGLVNIYDSFYIPGVLQNMEVFLNYTSAYNIFLNIGNKTIYRGNGSNMQVTLDDAQLRNLLDYQNMNQKTIPIRLGLENVSYILNISNEVDVFSVTDLSGSMFGKKLTEAKNANNQLIDGILNFSGNRVGLAAYSTIAKKDDFHALSNDSTSLRNEVNSWVADGYTCICCGILKAISCFDKNIFFDNFNGQNVGSDPIGWGVAQGNGNIYITDSALEGDRGVDIERLFSQNPVMAHYFAPQQDKISTEFLVRHNSGSGTVRINIQGANDGFSGFQDYIIIKMYDGWIRNNNAQVTAYSLGTIYKIKAEVVPGENTYDFYVNDALVGDNLPVYSTRNNVARILPTTETANVDYTLDDVKIFLTDSICNSISESRNRVAVVMSDGQGNRACGLDPVQDYDQDGDTTDDPSDHAIEAACIAKQNHDITVHAVGFGSGADTETLQSIASCGQGSFYFGDVNELVEIYKEIAQEIINATYFEQTIFGGGIETELGSDSHISVIYNKTIPYGLVINAETNQFGVGAPVGNFYIPLDTTPYEVKVASYSGTKWTSNVEVYNNLSSTWSSVFNLTNYEQEYTSLGDPYIVNIPLDKVFYENNSLRVFIGLGKDNSTSGSPYNKIIYSVVKNVSSFSPILSSADGCIWTIFFEDGTNSTMKIPASYNGTENCFYDGIYSVYNNNDAIDYSIFSLLSALDLNSNGMIETKFSENDLSINSVEISGIPFVWETEAQARVWR